LLWPDEEDLGAPGRHHQASQSCPRVGLLTLRPSSFSFQAGCSQPVLFFKEPQRLSPNGLHPPGVLTARKLLIQKKL